MSRFPTKRFSLLAGLLGLSLVAWAQDPDAPQQGRLELDPLVVVASRSPRPLSEVAAQVSVIDAQDIRQNLVENLDDLLRYEPGLDVETAGTRFGATGINIRGIGGNRVYIEQDGIPLRDRFVVGAFSDGGRALAETDRIKRVEVLHGPASSMYGSNALGGVVIIHTWDPADLLSQGQDGTQADVRSGYQSVNDSRVLSGVAALGRGRHGLMVAYTDRDGHQMDHQATGEIPDDPQNWHSRDGMLRYTYDTEAGNLLRITAMAQERNTATQINSQLGFGTRFRTTTELRSQDEDKNQRFALDYEFHWAGWEQGVARLFKTAYDTRQLTLETRGAARIPVALERLFDYQQNHDGAEINLFRTFGRGAGQHRLGLGLEWLQTDTRELRDGLQTNLASGATTAVILGESLPVRDFPVSRSRELGFFIQDEITLGGGRWQWVPALRWDDYQLDPRPDAIWLADFPDTAVVAVSQNRFTPRLGVLFHANEAWTLYGQYARGFRAPPFEDANIGLDIPLFGFRAIPNPDLKSETSDGFEIGTRRMAGDSRFSLAFFYTDYDEFIETRALIGVDPATGDLLFQSRNIDQARIYGLDLRFDQDLGQWSRTLDGWLLHLAAYWSRGDNRESDQPLNSIAPAQLVTGLSWLSPAAVWDVKVTSTLSARKQGSDVDQTAGERFATAGWGILDFTAGWQAAPWLELRAGVFNLGDKTYWRWLDVANFAPDNPVIPLLSRPGRNVSVNARITF